MRVLIIGGTGFIGPYVARELSERGAQVTLLHRGERESVLAALHPAAANRVYNVGEAFIPTIAERLGQLPSSTIPPATAEGYDFRQDIAYDTTRIRKELGYSEPISYDEGLKRTLAATVI